MLLHFRPRDLREEFYKFFREVEEAYEILSPDPFLRPYLEDYQRLVQIYRLLREAYEPHVAVDKSFLRKTAEIVQRHTQTTRVAKAGAVHEISGGALAALLAQEKPDTVKVFNLLKAFYRMVNGKGKQAPHLIPIGERAEEIRRRFEERQIETKEALEKLSQLVDSLRQAEAEREESQLSAEAFAVEWWLRTRQVEPERARRMAEQMEAAFRKHPHWSSSMRDERELRKGLYKVLGEHQVENLVEWVEHILSLLRRAAE
ncbi:hypothetical protein [Meiothermus rufus]|uniref:hypothetical protein n=1 Tax=Meiothermus rufus TaxID=604332 RepID=UPI00056ACA85|nr:hypothetical protein [Meiothermus rufus]